MTFEELKAEANAQGYLLIRKQNVERLLPCTCGSKRREHWSKWIGGELEESLVCHKCGKRASGFSKAEVHHNWNEMIKAEMGDEDDIANDRP